jgi:hypothetical protein
METGATAVTEDSRIAVTLVHNLTKTTDISRMTGAGVATTTMRNLPANAFMEVTRVKVS